MKYPIKVKWARAKCHYRTQNAYGTQHSPGWRVPPIKIIKNIKLLACLFWVVKQIESGEITTRVIEYHQFYFPKK